MKQRTDCDFLAEKGGIEDRGMAVSQRQDRPFSQIAVAAPGEIAPEGRSQLLGRLGFPFEIRWEKVSVSRRAADGPNVEYRPIRAVKGQIRCEARDTGQVLLHAEPGRLVKLRGERRVAARKILREQRPAAPERHAEMLR